MSKSQRVVPNRPSGADCAQSDSHPAAGRSPTAERRYVPSRIEPRLFRLGEKGRQMNRRAEAVPDQKKLEFDCLLKQRCGESLRKRAALFSAYVPGH